MEKKNIDWGSLGFAYMPTDKRFVANYKDGACLVCGTADPNYKPAGSGEQTGGAQEDANSPQTGDESNPALWFALTLASGTAAIAAAAYGCWKRREQ